MMFPTINFLFYLKIFDEIFDKNQNFVFPKDLQIIILII